jgi:hypothetical protein
MIFASYITTHNQGGIALAHRQAASNSHIKSPRRHGPNVISCYIQSGDQHTPLIGVYLPPSHLNNLPYLIDALDRFPNESPILMGDLNVNLRNMTPDRTQQVSATLATNGLEDLLLHFQQCKRF